MSRPRGTPSSTPPAQARGASAAAAGIQPPSGPNRRAGQTCARAPSYTASALLDWRVMERLVVAQIAEKLGIKPSTWRAYVARGHAPAPDGHYDKRTPWWWDETIDEFNWGDPKYRAA